MSNSLLDDLNRELAAASASLVGNGDLLRGILSGCGDCIKILDLDGRLQFMSDGGKRVMEVDDFSILKGCPWPDLWSGEGNAQAVEAVTAAKAGRTARFRSAADTAKGNPRYWDVQVSPIFGADGKPAHILSISRDITEEWKAVEAEKINAARQRFLTQELTHRVKNTLANVIAIANQTFRGEIHSESRKIFSRRIKTLGDAYDVLNASYWSNTPMQTVVDAVLKPYSAYSECLSIAGPAYDLTPHQSLALALALNEMATNAIKYGALSVPSGAVDISWRVDAAGFQFAWTESGGPPVTAPTRTGFGSRLIKDVLAADFKGAVDVRYPPSGFSCVLKVRFTGDTSSLAAQ